MTKEDATSLGKDDKPSHAVVVGLVVRVIVLLMSHSVGRSACDAEELPAVVLVLLDDSLCLGKRVEFRVDANPIDAAGEIVCRLLLFNQAGALCSGHHHRSRHKGRRNS